MARGPRYKVPRRRRREGKTNYYKRYRMILSGKPRFVVRKTLNHVIVQIIRAEPQGDVTVAAAHSRELAKRYGWRGGLANTPAAYLTGLLAALRAKRAGITVAAPDIGLHKPTRGAIVFAAIKAANDAGLSVPVSDEVVPSDDRIRGEHIASWASLLKENSEAYERMFSRYLARGLEPESLPAHFEEVRNRILGEYSDVYGEGGGK